MLAIQTNLIFGIVGIIIAFVLYQKGYKKFGVNLCRGILGALLCWGYLVLVIGLAPVGLG